MQTVFLAFFVLLFFPCFDPTAEKNEMNDLSAHCRASSLFLFHFFFPLLFPPFHDVLIRETGVRAVARLHIRCAVFFSSFTALQ